MVCAKCGAKVDGFKFCPECGTPTAAAAAEAPTQAVAAQPTGEVEVTPRQLPVTPAAAVEPTIVVPATTVTPATRVVSAPVAPVVPVQELRYVPAEPPADPAPLIVLAAITAIAGVCAVLLRLYTLQTDQQTLRVAYVDIATNSVGAAIAAALVVVLGAALAANDRPVGAGLLGGSGLALAALATMPVAGTDQVYRLFIRHQLGNGTFTHEAAFFVALGTIAFGIVTFFVSISYATAEGSTHPGVRAASIVGLVGTVAVVLGPLLPLDGAKFADNFTGDNGRTLSLLIRVGGIVLILLAGVVGFLNNSTWGLGVALGGISTWAYLWFTAQFEMGSHPAGPAFQNPGAKDLKPHAVTTIGVLVILVASIVGIVIAVTANRQMRVEVRTTHSSVN